MSWEGTERLHTNTCSMVIPPAPSLLGSVIHQAVAATRIEWSCKRWLKIVLQSFFYIWELILIEAVRRKLWPAPMSLPLSLSLPPSLPPLSLERERNVLQVLWAMTLQQGRQPRQILRAQALKHCNYMSPLGILDNEPPSCKLFRVHWQYNRWGALIIQGMQKNNMRIRRITS